MHRVRRSLTLPALFAVFLTLTGAGRGERVLDAREPAGARGDGRLACSTPASRPSPRAPIQRS